MTDGPRRAGEGAARPGDDEAIVDEQGGQGEQVRAARWVEIAVSLTRWVWLRKIQMRIRNGM